MLVYVKDEEGELSFKFLLKHNFYPIKNSRNNVAHFFNKKLLITPNLSLSMLSHIVSLFHLFFGEFEPQS